jgi:D-glycero-alpha-D-manno-heptose 1-phosphate guanylyltransferase
MEAIILAGGFGTRLRQLVPDLPKPMAPVAGRPFLEILLSALASKGFKRVILSTGYMAEKISSYFGDQYAGMELSYVVEEQPLGTGGAVRLALTQCHEDHVFIFNGDTYLDLEVEAIEKLWQTHKRSIIVGREVLDTARYGRLLTANGSVSGFAEKGGAGPGLINAGCYVFCRHQLDSFQPYFAFSLETDYLATEVTHRLFDVFVTDGLFIDIGIPQDFQLAQTVLAGVS